MTTSTLTLSAFLLARIAEDEAAARAASPGPWQYGDVESVAGGMLYDQTRTIGSVAYEQASDHDGRIVRHLLVPEADANGEHIARYDPARVLAECEAKRLIVENPHPSPDAHDQWEDVLLTLAEVYANHPDFRQEWRA